MVIQKAKIQLEWGSLTINNFFMQSNPVLGLPHKQYVAWKAIDYYWERYGLFTSSKS
jgi:hypothetical protein